MLEKQVPEKATQATPAQSTSTTQISPEAKLQAAFQPTVEVKPSLVPETKPEKPAVGIEPSEGAPSADTITDLDLQTQYRIGNIVKTGDAWQNTDRLLNLNKSIQGERDKLRTQAEQWQAEKTLLLQQQAGLQKVIQDAQPPPESNVDKLLSQMQGPPSQTGSQESDTLWSDEQPQPPPGITMEQLPAILAEHKKDILSAIGNPAEITQQIIDQRQQEQAAKVQQEQDIIRVRNDAAAETVKTLAEHYRIPVTEMDAVMRTAEDNLGPGWQRARDESDMANIKPVYSAFAQDAISLGQKFAKLENDLAVKREVEEKDAALLETRRLLTETPIEAPEPGPGESRYDVAERNAQAIYDKFAKHR